MHALRAGLLSSFVAAAGISILGAAGCGSEGRGRSSERSFERVAESAQALVFPSDGRWHWIQGGPGTLIPAQCLDGSASGFGMNVPPSWNGKVLLWLDGGGACYDKVTCTTNLLVLPHVAHTSYALSDFNNDVGYDTITGFPVLTPNTGDANYDPGSGYLAFNWTKSELVRGIFDRSTSANVFQNYAYVFLPYCSGDFHVGNNFDCVPGTLGCNNQPTIADRQPSGMHHMGASNTEAAYVYTVASFPGATQYVLTGGSAGGFGTIYTYNILRSLVPSSVPITLISDAGDPVWTGSPDPNMPSTWNRQGYLLRQNPNGTSRPPPAPGVESYVEDYMADAWRLGTSLPSAITSAPYNPFGSKHAIYPIQSVWTYDATNNMEDKFGLCAGSDDWAYSWLFPLNGPLDGTDDGNNPANDQPNIYEGLNDFSTHALGLPNTTMHLVSVTTRPPARPACISCLLPGIGCSATCAALRPWNNHHAYLLDDVSVWDSNQGGSGVTQYLAQLHVTP